MYKLAFIGYGGVAEWHHNMLDRQCPKIKVAGAFDIRPEAMERAKSKRISAYESLVALLSDKTVDIALVATPNNVHKELTIAALKSGKHTICEKPATLNAKELEEVMEAAKSSGRIFTVHQNRRWDKDFQTIRKVIEDGMIGDIYSIQSRVQGSRRIMHGWRGYKINGGGLLYDWGAHLIDQLMHLIKEPVCEISCNLFNIHAQEVDDNLKMSLRFNNGVHAYIEIDTNCFILLPRWHVCGTEGSAVVENWELDGRVVTLADRTAMEWGEDIIYTAAGPTRTMTPRPANTIKESPLPQVSSKYCQFYENLTEAIEGKQDQAVKPEQVLRVMKVIDAAFDAHERKQAVKCFI
ncbi:MAG: Gfo/Idh/MocA family oxidoreductase [Oscillospiraceae bacterium]|nr:Gfo/Idh/MocA family oxidoreductase [Oscillospiraceae bacterium]